MLPHATLSIDAVAVRASSGSVSLVVGEVKVYPDRGGYTDEAQLATSRAQAGVYVHGLRLVHENAPHLKTLAEIRRLFVRHLAKGIATSALRPQRVVSIDRDVGRAALSMSDGHRGFLRGIPSEIDADTDRAHVLPLIEVVDHVMMRA
jgi:hypothetical protein